MCFICIDNAHEHRGYGRASCQRTMHQETEGPYAWRHTTSNRSPATRKGYWVSTASSGVSSVVDLGSRAVYPHGPLWSQCLSSDMLARTSLQNIVEKATSAPMNSIIDFRLPLLNANAGGVLRHAVKTLEALFNKHAPLTFKIGYTHDPVWRWVNHLYGYDSSIDNFANMTILYISDEHHSAAMLEACLIDKYGSILAFLFQFMSNIFPKRFAF